MVAGLVEFEWDDDNRGHLAEHLVSSQEAEEVVLNRPVDLERQNRNGETRILQVGETNAGRILVVVSAFSGRKIRVITAWPAKERLSRYWRSLQPSAEGEE
ncbi:MAG: BrnT family toxin [Acidobacteriaceae bacterium]